MPEPLLEQPAMDWLHFFAFIAVSSAMVVYQRIKHGIWWSGFFESAFHYMFHEHLDYRTEVRTAKDGEEYLILHPRLNRTVGSNHKHLWIVIPGAMKKLSECMESLERDYNAFDGSDLHVFNQPGIENGTVMKQRPTPPPTDIRYLWEYIQSVDAEGRYSKISVIAFSMGALSALFLLDEISKYPPKRWLESIVMVHSPEFIRETFQSLHSNWIFRFDILCAHHVLTFNKTSGSWTKFGTEKKMKHQWYEGWPFMKEITEINVGTGEKWEEFECRLYDPHRVLRENSKNEKVECCRLKRIVSRNDPIVPFPSVDSAYFGYYDEVIVMNRGGHCIAVPEIAKMVTLWNSDIVHSIS